MFFIGIFGVEEKEKELREFADIVCPGCGRSSSAVLTLRYTYFHIFFIPVFRWSRHYYISVRSCGAVYEADAEYGRELEAGRDIDFSRLKKVSSGFCGFEDSFTACRNCGGASDPGFAYCPHCGAKKG